MPETTERIRACSVPAAALLLDRSERTLQRWCEDGTLQVVHRDVRRGSRQLVNLAQVLEFFGPHSTQDFAALIEAADAGSAEAETDLGLALLQEGKAVAAVAFFQRAARQDDPEAMHWLYRCYREGLGIERDENLAMMWLHKAAAHRSSTVTVVSTRYR
ncbi:MAG: sel1 repeat family protein [Thiomonas arsenitoxydans]|nr:sel1 repeat family protein [Thiomonas arsenitoxydans]